MRATSSTTITARLCPALQTVVFGLVLVALATGPGCQKRLDPQQYGEVLYELPKIPGAEKPYPLPQLEDPSRDAAKAEK